MKDEVIGTSVEVQENQAVFTLDRKMIERLVGEKTDKEWFAYANEVYAELSGDSVSIGLELKDSDVAEALVEKYFNEYEQKNVPFPEFLI